jgi:hypothetical protein
MDQLGTPKIRNPNFKCFYCHQNSHGTNRCDVIQYDAANGNVLREGKEYKLPNNSRIPWDTSRPIKQIVDEFAKEAVGPTTSTSFGQLEELDHSYSP